MIWLSPHLAICFWCFGQFKNWLFWFHNMVLLPVWRDQGFKLSLENNLSFLGNWIYVQLNHIITGYLPTWILFQLDTFAPKSFLLIHRIMHQKYNFSIILPKESMKKCFMYDCNSLFLTRPHYILWAKIEITEWPIFFQNMVKRDCDFPQCSRNCL